GAEEIAREGVVFVLDGGDQALEGRPARVGADEQQAVSFHDDPRALRALPDDVLAEPAGAAVVLGRFGRRLLPEPDELRVRVVQARAGAVALVYAGEEVREAAGARRGRPCTPGFDDQAELIRLELDQRSDVSWRMDDHFVPIEGGELVGHDADAPARRVLFTSFRRQRE